MLSSGMHYYYEVESERLRRAAPWHAARHREAWARGHAPARSLGLHLLAGELGDALVRAGERLRAWSASRAAGVTS